LKDHRKLVKADQPSLKHFSATWTSGEKTRNIILRKWIPFAKCDTCSTLREDRENTKDPKERQRIEDRLYHHICFVRRERTSYYRRRVQSVENPNEYLSLIVDEADQKLYDLPHAATQSKTEAQAWLVPVKLIGVLVHGRGGWAFTHVKNCKSGSNITIDAIHRVLVEILETEGKLPDKLYVQLDNTTRQCKNRFVVGYLAYLVECGVFKKIVLSFLPKGHTHEDIDQMFSRYAIALRRSTVWSRQDLEQVLVEAWADNEGRPVRVRHMDSVTNMSDWLEKYVPKEQYKGITGFHQFKIWRRLSGVVSFAVRACCASREGFTGLHGLSNWVDAFPEGIPPPLYIDDIPAAQRFDVAEDRKLQTLAAEGKKIDASLKGLLAKMTNGVEAMEELYNRDAPDCYTILGLMSATDPIKCAWPAAEVKKLYHDYRSTRFLTQVLTHQGTTIGVEVTLCFCVLDGRRI
jgi:hypothetical protein